MPIIVTMPTGDTPCPTGPEMVCEPAACCNYYDTFGGKAFEMSVGGPMGLSPGPTCESYECPPAAALGPLPVTPPVGCSGCIAPGPLNGSICADLPPGSYRVTFRYELVNALPGTRVVLLYQPVCGVTTTEYLVSDQMVPCAQSADPGGTVNSFCGTFHSQLDVPNAGCQPGFRILAQTGCAPCPEAVGTVSQLRNVQIGIEPLSARDVVQCGGSPLEAQGVTFCAATPLCPVGV